jgi:hypothetical protein
MSFEGGASVCKNTASLLKCGTLERMLELLMRKVLDDFAAVVGRLK